MLPLSKQSVKVPNRNMSTFSPVWNSEGSYNTVPLKCFTANPGGVQVNRKVWNVVTTTKCCSRSLNRWQHEKRNALSSKRHHVIWTQLINRTYLIYSEVDKKECTNNLHNSFIAITECTKRWTSNNKCFIIKITFRKSSYDLRHQYNSL